MARRANKQPRNAGNSSLPTQVRALSYNDSMDSWDVIIAGAGIIGVSLALELRERGAQVLVLDKGEPGAEASSAAAGMLAASDPETPVALRPLATESARMFPDYVSTIDRLAGLG